MADSQTSGSIAQKLQDLIERFEMTSLEIGIPAGVQMDDLAIYQFRIQLDSTDITDEDTAFRERIEQLHELATLLRDRYYIEVENIRALLIGRSAYFNEQRPVMLLRAGEFELVKEGAIAYATSKTPDEFREDRYIPQVPEDC